MTILHQIISVGIGAIVGGIIGHFGKCSSGGCPLTANPFRGAIYGGVMGLLFSMSAPPAPLSPEEQAISEAGVVHISTATELNQQILQNEKPCLVDFYSNHCPPCRRLAPTIGKLATKYEDQLIVCKVDTDAATSLARQFDIRSIPCVIFFNQGKEVQRVIGLHSQSKYEKIIESFTP